MIENPLSIELVYPPIPFRANGKKNLVFETIVHNSYPAPDDTDKAGHTFKVSKVRITAPDGFEEVWDAEKIKTNLSFWNEIYRPVKSERLEPGNKAILYYWIALEEDAPTPQTLSIQLGLENASGGKETLSLEVNIQQRQPLVIQPPVHGAGWVAGEAASNFTGHRRTPLAFDGVVYVPQRYAVDWIKFDANGKLFHDSPDKNESWFGHGAEVSAVADGVVIEVLNGIPENVPLTEEMAVKITLQNAPGNYILQDLGGEQYALYAHLQPGSLTVKTGDRVKTGQVLGKLGNSGNSTGPHLHFHIGNRPAPLGMQGMPYHLPEYIRVGNIRNAEELETLIIQSGGCWQPDGAPETRRNEYMGSNDVIDFQSL